MEEGSPPREGDLRSRELEDFAIELSDDHPKLFGSVNDVLAFFNDADEFQRTTVPSTRLSQVCTFTKQHSNCWAVKQQKAWNRVLTPRGVQLIELQIGTLHFRTLNVDPEELSEEEDVKFLCLCLWLLRHHRCINSVSLYIPVVAPRHGSVFTNRLRFTSFVQRLEIRGDSPFRVTPGKDSPSGGRPVAIRFERRLRDDTFNCLSELRELALSSLNFSSNEELCNLTGCLARNNETLTALILIDVEMSAEGCFILLMTVSQNLYKLQDFRIKTSGMKPRDQIVRALPLVGSMRTVSRLYVHADHGMVDMLQCLSNNSMLKQLTLEPVVDNVAVLAALANLICGHPVHMRLKIRLDIPAIRNASTAMDHLDRMIRRGCLRSLVLSGSTITLSQLLKISHSLELSDLEELYVDDCDVACEAVEKFSRAIFMRKDTFKELNVGSPVGSEEQQQSMFSYMVAYGVCGKITLVYTDSLVRNYQLWARVPAFNHFTKVTLCCSEKTLIEPVLRILRNAKRTLESLSITAAEVLSSMGATFVAQLIQECTRLRVLRLRCRINENGCVHILRALAASRTVVLLTVERWDITRRVTEAFADMLRENRSLYRLEFYWQDIEDFQDFSLFLTKGLTFNRTVAVMKVYQGPQRDEVIDLNESTMVALQRNEMLLSWVTEVILRDRMALEGTVLADLLDVCDAPLDMYQRSADYSPRTSANRAQWALMATRSTYYALREAFPEPIHRSASAEAQRRLQDVIRAVEMSVEDKVREAGFERVRDDDDDED